MKKLFGTDGVRGTANSYPITPEAIMRLGKAAAIVLRNGKKRPKIIIGKDPRLSGYMIENALTAGILSVGGDVLLVGPMPTPAIAHLVKSFAADAGMMISASHNPAHDNGVKLFSSQGIKLSDEIELKIEKLFFSEKISTEIINGGSIGKAYRIDDARGRYIEFAKSAINNRSLAGLKIVLDCANGAAYKVAPLILQELGAEVIVMNNSPNGLNINLNCGALHPENVAKQVLKHKADVGIALDGDADRIIMVDEAGKIVDGDQIMSIIALDMIDKGELRNNTLVVTSYSNLGLDEAIKKAGGRVVRVRNGDRYVIEEMLAEGYNFGGEQSGHIILFDYTMTGDGTIAALKMLDVIKHSRKKLSELAKCMKKYPQIILNIEVKEKRPLRDLNELTKAIDSANKTLGKQGRTLVRYSGTQNLLRIMVEGKEEKLITKLAKNISDKAKKELK